MSMILGVDRTTYSSYEQDKSPCPVDKLEKIIDLFKIQPENILDEYQCFVYEGQGIKIKQLRKQLNMRQSQLAQAMQVNVATVKKWEAGRIAISRQNYEKLKSVL